MPSTPVGTAPTVFSLHATRFDDAREGYTPYRCLSTDDTIIMWAEFVSISLIR